jgi:carnitine-CoA ligase
VAWSKYLEPDHVVMRNLLERNAREAPEQPFISFEDGTSWTRAQAVVEASRSAHELHCAGLRQGGVLAVALPNSIGYFRALWGSAMLGASVTPVNVAYRGRLITHMVEKVRPRVVVTTDDFRSRLLDSGAQLSDIAVLAPEDLVGTDGTPPALERPIEPWDPVSMALTSGTTGPAKVVRVAYAQSRHAGEAAWLAQTELTSDDVYLCDVPMVHVAGLYATHAALANRSRIVVRSRPDLDHYWEVARDAGATWAQLYSTMVTYLESRPDRGAEHAHHLRIAVTLPMPADPETFKKRFGIPQLTIGWGSTEIGMAIGPSRGEHLPLGSTGRALPGWQVRIVDENDIDVPDGAAGQAIVRSDTPWTMTTGYLDEPGATAEVWRNGWLHSGDLMRRDAEGFYYFVDRVTDSLRRRGQNVSSFEVEAAVLGFPGVVDAAAVAERSDTGAEDEVKVWVVTDGDSGIDFAELLRHCADRLPHYMVPRYFEQASTLPKTPSAKVQKHLLRERGSGAATWDRQAHRLDVTRAGLVTVRP